MYNLQLDAAYFPAQSNLKSIDVPIGEGLREVKSTPEHFVKTTRQRMMSAGQNVLLDDFTACSKLDLSAKLPALQVPTLILASQEDRMVKAAEIEAMAHAIPKAQLQIFHACGHFLHVEIASEIAKELVALLDAQD